MRYDFIARDYARHRGAQPHVLDALVRVAATTDDMQVLEVGCGTGGHASSLRDFTGSACTGVDPSRDMLAQASAHPGVRLACATGESLPFTAAAFDLVFSVNVIHHLSCPARYFREARRVLRAGGRLCTFTDSGEMIRRRRPLSRYWPGSARADLERYPGLDSLRAEMTAAGFESLCEMAVRAPFAVTDAAPYRDRVFSCLRLISDAEFLAGLGALERDLARGPVQGLSELVALWGTVAPVSCDRATRSR